MLCVYPSLAAHFTLLMLLLSFSWSARALEDGPGERQHLFEERLPEIIDTLAPLQSVVHHLSMPAGVLIIAKLASTFAAEVTRDRHLLFLLTNYHYAESVELKTSQ